MTERRSSPISRANHIAAAVLPAAVGPQITRTGTSFRASTTRDACALLLPAKAALELRPAQLHDRRTAMHVVRGQPGVAERDEERAHLALRELVACLDRRLACDRCREAF